MAKERVFQLRSDSNNDFAVREQAHKSISGEHTRIRVLFGLDAELRIIDPCILINNAFIDCDAIALKQGVSLNQFIQQCRKDGTPLHYNMSKLTYLCQHAVVQVKGKTTQSRVSIYVPIGLAETGIVCTDVTLSFPRQSRVSIAEKFLDFTLSRIQ